MMTPDQLADARERCGYWGPETDLQPIDPFEERPMVLTRARYEAKDMGPSPTTGERVFGLFDTFQQTFIAGETFPTITQAIAAVRRLNNAYERAMAP